MSDWLLMTERQGNPMLNRRKETKETKRRKQLKFERATRHHKIKSPD
jgi:hypothetical protein